MCWELDLLSPFLHIDDPGDFLQYAQYLFLDGNDPLWYVGLRTGVGYAIHWVANLLLVTRLVKMELLLKTFC